MVAMIKLNKRNTKVNSILVVFSLFLDTNDSPFQVRKCSFLLSSLIVYVGDQVKMQGPIEHAKGDNH